MVLSMTLPQHIKGDVQGNITFTQIPHSPPSHMSGVQILLLGFALAANNYWLPVNMVKTENCTYHIYLVTINKQDIIIDVCFKIASIAVCL